jgi:hypothetical protein
MKNPLAANSTVARSGIAHTTIRNPRQVGHTPVPGRQVIEFKFIDMSMTTSSRHHFYQFNGRLKKVFETLGRFFNDQPLPQMIFLGGDTNGTVISIAGSHSNTTDGLQGRVGQGNRVCS